MIFSLKGPSCSMPAILFIMIVISGCAIMEPVKPPDVKVIEPEEDVFKNGWWYARFRIKWPEKENPSWHIDLLIANKIISPVLYQYKSKIILWRFHRRAIRDKYGHQFSFIFYSSPEAAQQIYNSLKSYTLLKEMKIAGVIIQDIYDDLGKITKPYVEDTSDQRWSSQMKKSWPYYIMGVSRMWLDLITEISGQISKEKKPATLEENQTFYQQVNERVKELWQKEGRHALLHHLNAIFGYEPLRIYEERIIRF